MDYPIIHNKSNYKSQSGDKISNKISLAAKTNKISFTQRSLYMHHIDQISKIQSLTSLDLYDCVNLHGKMGFVCGLTNLTDLNLSFSNILDDDLVHLRELKHLVNLNLTQNLINGSGFPLSRN